MDTFDGKKWELTNLSVPNGTETFAGFNSFSQLMDYQFGDIARALFGATPTSSDDAVAKEAKEAKKKKKIEQLFNEKGLDLVGKKNGSKQGKDADNEEKSSKKKEKAKKSKEEQEHEQETSLAEDVEDEKLTKKKKHKSKKDKAEEQEEEAKTSKESDTADTKMSQDDESAEITKKEKKSKKDKKKKDDEMDEEVVVKSKKIANKPKEEDGEGDEEEQDEEEYNNEGEEEGDGENHEENENGNGGDHGEYARPQKYDKNNIELLLRTLFVGNVPAPNAEKDLPAHKVQKKLKQLFSPYGKILSVRLRSVAIKSTAVPETMANYKAMRKISVSKSNTDIDTADSCTAYIVFETKEAVDKIKAQENKTEVFKMNDFILRVDSATGKGKGTNRKHNFDYTKTVFVGNLPFDKSHDNAIINAFGGPSKVEAVRIIRDRATQLGKGFGYVLFKNDDLAKEAISQSDTLEFNGRKLRITRCQKNPEAGKSKETYLSSNFMDYKKKRNGDIYKADGGRDAKRPRFQGDTAEFNKKHKKR